jgi:hypothetical protein
MDTDLNPLVLLVGFAVTLSAPVALLIGGRTRSYSLRLGWQDEDARHATVHGLLHGLAIAGVVAAVVTCAGLFFLAPLLASVAGAAADARSVEAMWAGYWPLDARRRWGVAQVVFLRWLGASALFYLLAYCTLGLALSLASGPP